MSNPQEDHVAHYLELFLERPLAKILREYNSIELGIIEDLTSSVCAVLEGNGFVRHGGHFTRGGEHYRIIADFLTKGRTLRICLLGLANLTERGPAITQSEEVEHFGLVRRIVVESAVSPPFDLGKVAQALREQAKSAYAALEQSVMSNIESLERAVFRRLHDCLRVQFKLSNKEDLLGRFWLFVAEPEVGFYFFDKEAMEKVIAHYKQNQDETISPLELTVWIMTAPLPFQKSLSIEAWRAKKVLSLPWDKARYIDDAERIFVAERLLYGSEEYSASTICEARGYYLVAGCPTEIEHAIFPEIKAQEALLVKYFRQGMKEWSSAIRMVKKLSKIAEESTVASFIGTVLGKAAGQFVK